jgi:hypothetical protein
MKTIVLVVALALGLTGCVLASKPLLSVTDPALYDLTVSCGTYVTRLPEWRSTYNGVYAPRNGLFVSMTNNLGSVHAAMVEDCRQYRAMRYGSTVNDAPRQRGVLSSTTKAKE